MKVRVGVKVAVLVGVNVGVKVSVLVGVGVKVKDGVALGIGVHVGGSVAEGTAVSDGVRLGVTLGKTALVGGGGSCTPQAKEAAPNARITKSRARIGKNTDRRFIMKAAD